MISSRKYERRIAPTSWSTAPESSATILKIDGMITGNTAQIYTNLTDRASITRCCVWPYFKGLSRNYTLISSCRKLSPPSHINSFAGEGYDVRWRGSGAVVFQPSEWCHRINTDGVSSQGGIVGPFR